MKRPIGRGMTCVILWTMTGCGTATTPAGDDFAQVDTLDPGGPADSSADADDTTWTRSDAKAAASQAASTLAQSLITVLPIKELQEVFEGTAPMPDCPTLQTTIDPAAILLTFDYQTGCTPPPYATPILAGVVTGNLFTSSNSFEMSLDPVTFNGAELSGTQDGSYSTAAGATTFALSSAITRNGTEVYRAGATASFDETTGAITIDAASVTVTTDDLSLSVLIDSAVIDPDGDTLTAPTGGTAIVTNHRDGAEFEIVFGP